MLRAIVAIVLVVLAALTLWFSIGFTPPILKEEAVSELRRVELNGAEQWVLIRGHRRDAPLLLFLHGGPGMPAMYLAHDFQAQLERDFIVVHWDQRGAGKSYDADMPLEALSVSQLLADAETLTEQLLDEFGQERLYLLGHSHGGYLGVLLSARRPELFNAYIGVGQVVDEAEAMELQDAFFGGTFSESEITANDRETLLFSAGAELAAHESWLPLLWSGLRSPEYNLIDILNVRAGSALASAHMQYDDIDGELRDHVVEIEIPVFFVMGAADMVTPTSLARDYFEELAPAQGDFIVVEDAAHFPFYEQPDQFAAIMRRIRDDVSPAN